MRRPFFAGCLVLALASAGSTQSSAPLDDALSPIEIISSAPKPSPATATTAAQPLQTPETGAEPDTSTKKPAATNPADRDAEYLAQCLRDWDAATHMTRQEWARTCRRVVANRTKFMRDQLGK